MRQRARADNLTVSYRKKQIDISFSCVCPVIDNEFCPNIVKVVCGSTQLLPHGSPLIGEVWYFLGKKQSEPFQCQTCSYNSQTILTICYLHNILQ